MLLSYRTIEEIFRNFEHPIKLHTGVHSGEVIIEEIGKGRARDYTVIGDTVNLASRLQHIAHPGEIVVSEEVYKRTKSIFDFEEIGTIDIKGKAEPVKIFRLKSKKEKRGKIRGIEGLKSPFIGREEELNSIKKAFENYIIEKEDKVVLILGEPGIGKSRLFEEFKKDLKNCLLLEGRSLPYETEPLYSLVLILKELLEKKGKDIIEKLFPNKKVGAVPVFPFIELLLIGKIPDEIKNLPPDKIKELKFFVMESIFRKISEKENIIISFEDLHWADEETLEFLEHILSSPHKKKGIFFILLSRPPLKEKKLFDFFEFLKNIKNTEFINLKPLDFNECMELINSLLEIEELPVSLKKNILFGKSEGNPFFMEELIKVLIERGIIYKEGKNWRARFSKANLREIPSTIEEVILSRIDILGGEEKRTLKTASIMGRVFFKEGIENILKNNTEKELKILNRAGFIEPLQDKFLHFSQYQFKHILIQETVYNSLLRKHKKHLHLEFAKYMENLREKYPEIPPGILADHFEKGEDYEKAFLYHFESAERAKNNFANFEAIRRYKKAISIIDKISKFEERRWEILLSLGNIYSRLGKNKDALDSLKKALLVSKTAEQKSKIFEEMGDVYQRMSLYSRAKYYFDVAEKFSKRNLKRRLSLLQNKAWIFYLEGNMIECGNLLKEAGKLFESIKYQDENEKLKVKARLENLLGNYNIRCGNTEEGLFHYENALKIYEKLGDISGKAVIYNNMGGHLLDVGKTSKGIKMLLQSLEIDKDIGNYLGYAITCNNLGEAFIFLNQLDKAQKYFEEYLEVNKRIRNRLGDGYGKRGLAEIARKRKELGKAEKLYKESIAIFEEVKSEIMKNHVLAELADFYIEIGDRRGVDILEKVKEYSIQNKIEPLTLYVNIIYSKYYLKMFKETKEEKYLKNAEKCLANTEEFLEKSTPDLETKYEWTRLCLKLNEFLKKEEKIKFFKELSDKIFNQMLEGIEEEKDRKTFLEYYKRE